MSSLHCVTGLITTRDIDALLREGARLHEQLIAQGRKMREEAEKRRVDKERKVQKKRVWIGFVGVMS